MKKNILKSIHKKKVLKYLIFFSSQKPDVRLNSEGYTIKLKLYNEKYQREHNIANIEWRG
jgi:hypothetical protein